MLPQLKITISAEGGMMNSVKDIKTTRAVVSMARTEMKAAINY